MKKIILTLFVAIFAAIPSFAATYNAESRVPEIGKLLLTKNGIAITNVQFKVVSDDTDNFLLQAMTTKSQQLSETNSVTSSQATLQKQKFYTLYNQQTQQLQQNLTQQAYSQQQQSITVQQKKKKRLTLSQLTLWQTLATTRLH